MCYDVNINILYYKIQNQLFKMDKIEEGIVLI